MIRTLFHMLSLLAALGLVACDSGGPEAGRFESTVQTDPERRVTGTARFSADRENASGTEVFLDGGRPVFRIRDPEGRIGETGTYALGPSDGVWMTYSADFLASPVAEWSVVGTLRITRVSETEVEGRFDGVVQGHRAEPTSVEGAFAATPRED